MRGIGTNGRIPGLWDLSIIIKHALRLILGNFNNADFIREVYILKPAQRRTRPVPERQCPAKQLSKKDWLRRESWVQCILTKIDGCKSL